MIVKLTRCGEVVRYIEADSVFQQPVANGRIDIEVSKQNAPTLRFIIGEDRDNVAYPDIWNRAYLMENGKTVDTIKGHGMPMPASESASSGQGQTQHVTFTPQPQ